MIPGKATVAGTYDSFQNKSISYYNFKSSGWYASVGGVGTYRMSAQNPEHHHALRHALLMGINVIDSAINYMDGQSEELIGAVLKEMNQKNEISREGIILISKAGYIQGNLLQKLIQLEASGKSYQNILKLSDQLWYSLDPQFIKDMVDLSRKRMNVETIDIYMIHNPEIYIQFKMQEKGDSFDPAMDDFLFYQEIKRAFIALEEKVKEEHIQFYGVSSNHFPTPSNFPAHINLLKLYAMAHEAADEVWGDGRNHHFAILQFPFNIIESQAYLLKIDDFPEGPQTLFEFSKQHNLDVFVNRPLNAIWKNKLYRLAKYSLEPGINYQAQVKKILNQFLEYEQLLQKFCEAKHISNLPVGNSKLSELWEVTSYVENYLHQIEDLDQYFQFIYGFLGNRIRLAAEVFEKALKEDDYKEGMHIYQQYVRHFEFFAEVLKNLVFFRMNKRVEPIEEIVNEILPEKWRKWGLSMKSIKILQSLEEDFIILNGMRKEAYINEMIELLSSQKFSLSPEQFMALSKKIVQFLTNNSI